MFSIQENRLMLMGLNGCEILIIIILHKQSGLGIIELASAFEKLSPRYRSITSEELNMLGKVPLAFPINVEPIIEFPFGFSERPLIRMSSSEREERIRKHQQKLAVRHFKRK